MTNLLEAVRETFTVYLAMGMLFSAASIWAAVMALRTERADNQRRS
ncbi:MAG: hypothetical protein NTZ14_14180 [Hyphomicrobiales bacterium]|jgi:hypothetical protein|nr:hypothetical protein [Hyphomicrobiales bacterium]